MIIDKFINSNKKIKNEKRDNSNIVNVFNDPRFRAREFLKLQPLYYDINGLWWKWNSELCYWQYVEDDIEILNLVYPHFPILNLISSKVRTETLEGLKQEGRKNKPTNVKDSWVQYGTKIYDVSNNNVFDATSKYFNTNPIFFEVGENEDTPTINKLFKSWVKEEDVNKLYEKFAFVTIPKMIIHSFDVFYGPPGTGKSTATNLIAKFIGSHNTSATSIERINSNPRFETLQWHKKLMIKISEVSNIYDLKNTAAINNATGEDDIAAEKKGGTQFIFTNYAKFFNPTNKLLKIDPSDGFGRRVRVLNFTHRFEKEKDVLSEIPEIEFQNLAKKCLRIAKELWTNRSFTGDKTISERINDYQEISKSPLEQFIEKNYDLSNPMSFVIFSDFYSNYIKKIGYISKQEIGKQLKNSNFENKLKSIDTGNKDLEGKIIWDKAHVIMGLKAM